MSTTDKLSFAILGAGLLGSYLGARLQLAGHRVHFIGRGTLRGRLAASPYQGLAVTSVSTLSADQGARPAAVVPREQVSLFESYAAMRAAGVDVDHVVVTLKRISLRDTLQPMRPFDDGGLSVVTLMNGMNPRADVLEVLPRASVIVGMWPFNVVELAPGHFHQSVEGMPLELETTPAAEAVAAAFTGSGVATELSPSIDATLNGKLLVNLNNAVNALSGIPLKLELSTYALRQVVASCISEGLAVFAAHGMPSVSPIKVAPAWVLPVVMGTPDWVFTRVAAAPLAMDEKATSSMQEDLVHCAPTEIEYLQGALVRLGRDKGVPTPVCERVVQLIKRAEEDNRARVERLGREAAKHPEPPVKLTGEEILGEAASGSWLSWPRL
ncbi:hypothetical protein HK105_206514 [Polyrhizophydium stewartii]|uniref:2-dehydropantoate 2-reductase n=1 Tax=Polyrhizophydium stewartii TaxID=2732419 RepID=A0ABR4N380_9FUNG